MSTSKGLTLSLLIITALAFPGCAAIRGSLSMEDPLNAEEHNNLGVIYEREGKHKLALREYSRAIESDPSLATPLVNTANVYYKLGEYTNAEKYYKKALSKDERNLEAANNLASLSLETREDYEDALLYMLGATKGARTIPPYALDTLGALYIKTGDMEEGRSLLLRACGSEEIQVTTLEQVKTHLAEIGETCGRVN